jgi:hypothetical protein
MKSSPWAHVRSRRNRQHPIIAIGTQSRIEYASKVSSRDEEKQDTEPATSPISNNSRTNHTRPSPVSLVLLSYLTLAVADAAPRGQPSGLQHRDK